ncbi:MAG: protein translocase subunit SecDF [Bacteroidales bacterium]|nr:protein translocase subunit SecDF [Bacteroidales bacterium]
MQNKGFIRVFAVLLVLASLYSLSFTFFARKAEKDATEYAQGDFAKKQQFMDSIESLKSYYNFLGLRKFTYKECQAREINLGLDLKGGMNVMLQVSARDMILNLSDKGERDTMLLNTLDRAEEIERTSTDDFITIFGAAFQELYPNENMRLLFLGNEDIKNKINFRSTNQEVLKVLSEEADAAFSNTYNIIRTRIDRFGVTQPNIQRVGKRRILVELPGVQDQERVRDLLESSANLEFWETFNASEVLELLFEINLLIADLNKINTENDVVKDTDDTADKTEISQINIDTAQTEELSLKEQLKLEQDSLGIADTQDEETMEKMKEENPLFYYLTPNISRDGRAGFGPVVGYTTEINIRYVDSILALPEVKDLIAELNPELKLSWTRKAEENGFYSLVALKDYAATGKPALDGKSVVDARPMFSQNVSTTASVQMTMNSEGAREWRRITRENKERSVAIVLDKYVYSYPTVQNEISDGISSITGNFTIAEATDMANILKSGKLSAKADIISAEFVGPTLGQESINSGMSSFIIAFFLMLIFLLWYYQKAGFVASIALLLNVFLIFGVLASLGAALTLPGIAGLVLTIGMSVDANVIIYERIREQLALGKNIKTAISEGYKQSYSSIIDANVTTIIVGIILYFFGYGPVQGFAIILIIGILTSLFCAIFITRLTFEWLLTKKSEITFSSKLTKNAFKKLTIPFIEKRKVFYGISAAIIVVGLISMATLNFSLGVEFKGGRSYVVQLESGKRNTAEIEQALRAVYGTTPEVKTYGNENVKIITDYQINEKGAQVDSIVERKLFEGLQPMLPEGTDFNTFLQENVRQSDMVGPTIAADIMYNVVISVILALISIFLYIFLRFRNWQYGLGAVIALTHDVLVVLGAFSLLWKVMPFSMEIGQSFIAALLTIIGYSINDTVIIFDRIREVSAEYPKRAKLRLFNEGVNSTISRTIITSTSTLLVLLTILFFGGESIQGFVFAITIGVVSGTYSSLCIAAPVTYDLIQKNKPEEIDE